MSNIMVQLDVARLFCESEKNHETSQIRLFSLRDLKMAPSEYKPKSLSIGQNFFRVIHIVILVSAEWRILRWPWFAEVKPPSLFILFGCFSDETIHVAGFCGKEFGFL